MPHLSRTGACIVFAGVLLAYTVQVRRIVFPRKAKQAPDVCACIQCELASYLDRTGYTQPFFLLYLTHSSYALVGIAHAAVLYFTSTPIQPLLREVQAVIHSQLSSNDEWNRHGYTSRHDFPLQKAMRRLMALTILIAMPAGIWYSAISMTSMTSLTALYNLNAFWAYILSIYYARSEKWALRPSIAVGIACVGVLVMTYGDSKEIVAANSSSGNHLLGDVLGLAASAACGFYEVWYKRYIALPQADDVPLQARSSATTPRQAMHSNRPSYSRLLASTDDGTIYSGAVVQANGHAKAASVDSLNEDDYDRQLRQIDSEINATKAKAVNTQLEIQPQNGIETAKDDSGETTNINSPNPELFLLHANTITAAIGICTACTLWLPIPFLHYTGWETFRLPPDLTAFIAICGVCVCGVAFNAGFMILLSLWGPVVTSVGNLFTLVLVAIADEVIALLNGYSALSMSTLAGSGLILASFSMLVNQSGDGH